MDVMKKKIIKDIKDKKNKLKLNMSVIMEEISNET